MFSSSNSLVNSAKLRPYSVNPYRHTHTTGRQRGVHARPHANHGVQPKVRLRLEIDGLKMPRVSSAFTLHEKDIEVNLDGTLDDIVTKPHMWCSFSL